MRPRLSVVICVHNEEKRLEACLEKLGFADELVILLDKCTDNSKAIATRYAHKIIEGTWNIEGERRNAAIEAANGDWIFEVDADEHPTPELGPEIRQVINESLFNRHEIPVDNFIGDKLVRQGWGASFGKSAYPGLFRKGTKKWGPQRLHPSLELVGEKGPRLKNPILHYVDRDISDMWKRLNSYSSARAKDLRESGKIGSLSSNVRRFFSRFIKCYFFRKGYKEGDYGLMIALCAGLYPLLSYLKAKLEQE